MTSSASRVSGRAACFIIVTCAATSLLSIVFSSRIIDPGTFVGIGEEQTFLLLPEDHPDPYPQRALSFLLENDPSPLKDPTCNATSRVLIHKSGSFWMLQSLDFNGTRKLVGGDEYYITYVDENSPRHVRTQPLPSIKHHPSAIAHLVDLNNGQYELHFVKSRLPAYPKLRGRGQLHIVLQYTCGIGAIPPPLKQSWKASGALNRTWSIDTKAPPMQDPVAPLSFPHFKDYGTIWAVGDSLMRQFIGDDILPFPEESNDNERRVNMRLLRDFCSPLSTQTLETALFPAFEPNLFTSMGERNNSTFAKKNIKMGAILLGSGVWDVIADNEGEVSMENHAEAVERYVKFVQAGAPHYDVYWKSMTAMHIHIAPECERVMYLSSSRAKQLYLAQLHVMERLGIPVIDLYNMTYEGADWARPDDGRHFQVEFDDMMMDQVYPP